MDHRALLKKYMEHVGIEEGVTFLSPHDRGSREDSVEWTDEEWDELKRLEAEPLGDYYTIDDAMLAPFEPKNPCRQFETRPCVDLNMDDDKRLRVVQCEAGRCTRFPDRDMVESIEGEINFNTIVMGRGDGGITHSYSPQCPTGCYGQMDECIYKRE